MVRVLLALVLVLANAVHAATTERPDAALRALLMAAINDSSHFEDRFDAEVWLLDMSTRLEPLVIDPEERFQILKAVHREASRASLEPELVLAVISVESRFERFAISSAGARGLMQVMPFWLTELGRERDNLFEIDTNLRFGCTILKHYLEMEKGDLTRALARYNGSTGKTWYPRRVFRAYRTLWRP